jgi:xanthine dehydrogenase YagR molybdenum-binding subunit
MSIIGNPLSRVDGKLKVTGAATYSAEFQTQGVAYAVIVQSTIPSGRISAMNTDQASRAAGVIAVLAPGKAPKLANAQSRLSLLQDDKVQYNGQPIAVVVAERLEQAQHAASLMRTKYQAASPALDFVAGFPASYPGSHNNEPGDVSWGDVDAGLRDAAIKIDQVYTTPIQHHNPMEPHSIIAEWQGDRLTVHESTQDISGHRSMLAKTFGVPETNVEVISLFVGGAFGCKGQVWSHVVLAVMAAKQVNRPVKLVLERPQMFGLVGARPQTHQHLTLGATAEGKLTAIRHEVHANTSFLEDYLESSAFPTRVMYSCPNVATIHRLVQLNLGTPTYTRAPGVATGTYALEIAMDELAYQIKMDPLQLRLLNYAGADPHTGVPFTEKRLKDCYSRAADRFGWSKRKFEPGSMQSGNQLIGWGMATETYPGNRLPSQALIRFKPDGRVLVATGTHEIGTGMYTIMTQVAADSLGIDPGLVDAELGDTTLPHAPISAGSMSTASVTPAVQAAAAQARDKLLSLAASDSRSPAYAASVDQIDFQSGKVFRKSSPGKSETFSTLLARNGNPPIEATASVAPDPNNKKGFSSHSFGAIFVEVSVDPRLGIVRVPRIVAVYDVGKIINQKTANSQFIGGIVWGISLALHEDTYIDGGTGRILNANLAEYHVPVNADIGSIDVSALDVPDPKINPLGARGIGEIGITGTGAAVGNAIFHATGKRVRDLPITPDKLLG